MAAHLAIPYSFLAKILQKLSRAGLVMSKQGPRGGYLLARHPSEISFTDVFRAIDNPLLLVECVQPQSCSCPRLAVCSIIETMQVLQKRLGAVFDNVTIAELVSDPCTEPVGRLAP
jgi:Rrf2 family protein